MSAAEAALHRILDTIDDTIHQIHGGIKSPALETVDKLRLHIIDREGNTE